MLVKYEKPKSYPRQSLLEDQRYTRVLFFLLIILTPFLYWLTATSNSSQSDTLETVNDVFDDDQSNIQWRKGQVKGALVILAREQDLHGIRGTMRDIEDRFNHKHGYPYVILSEQDLSQKFRDWIRSVASTSKVYFGHIDEQMWNEPSWIDKGLAEEKALEMQRHGIYHGESMSWRKMARFNAGFLAHHPLLKNAEYYWKVNPNSRYLCDIEDDPFAVMKANGKKIGFAISMYENQRTIPTLWMTIQSYIYNNPDKVLNPDKSILPWISNNGRFNGCHIWNNFMIISLEFLRSEEYIDLFQYLDTSGGFFYERWGDAVVQTMAAALFLERNQVHYMENIGYFYSVATNCPTDKEIAHRLNCICDPQKSFIRHQFSCTEALLQLQQQQVDSMQ